MKILALSLVSILLCFSLTSCDKNDGNSVRTNGQVIVGVDEYETSPNDELTINSVVLNGDYLTINFSAGGCSGDSWEFNLIGSGVISLSNPPQLNLRLSLKDEELCEVLITKEVTFDIKKLRVDGNKVVLNILNYDEQIVYQY